MGSAATEEKAEPGTHPRRLTAEHRGLLFVTGMACGAPFLSVFNAGRLRKVLERLPELREERGLPEDDNLALLLVAEEFDVLARDDEIVP